MDKPFVEPGHQMRMVGQTTSLDEANRIAGRYELQGFRTHIEKKTQGGLTLYQVWATKKPEIKSI